MLHSSLIIMYGTVCVVGSIGYYLKGDVVNGADKFVLLFFTICHLFFLVLGVTDLFYFISVLLYVTTISCVLFSRILNGLFSIVSARGANLTFCVMIEVIFCMGGRQCCCM